MKTWAKVIVANEKDKSETKQKNRSWYQTCKQREKEKPRMTLADTVRHLAQIHPFEETIPKVHKLIDGIKVHQKPGCPMILISC